MDSLAYILDKYALDADAKRLPLEIANVGRDDLAGLFAELGYSIGAEIGVERGLYSEVLCRANPDLMLYGIDAWQAYKGYRDHVSQDKLDGFYHEAQTRMASYDWHAVRKFSMQAVGDFKDRSLDFVYIDGNHTLPYVINDILEWSKKVRKGGIMSGHDYRRSKRLVSQNHVVYAVNCYCQAYRVRPWFLFGRRERREGEVRDTARSWAWVKH
jgi:hypothetical protein